MVDIRLDCEKSVWKERALRYLHGGARLVGLSRSEIEVLERLAPDYGLRIRKEPLGDGWRVSAEVVARSADLRSDGPRSRD